MELLKLTALDEEDLGVVSAHMQDAVLRVGDIRYLKASKQLVLVVNRFAWDSGEHNGQYERRRTALHFTKVTELKAQRITTSDVDGVLSLLAISFEAGDPPSGTVILAFSGGGAIRAKVEYIEAQLEDLGPFWAATGRPSHGA